MNRTAILAAPLALTLLLAGGAVAPVSAATAADCAQAARNRALVERFYTDVMIGRQVSHAPKYLSPGYIQNNPHVAPKLAGFMKDFGENFSQPPPADYRREILNAVADDDLVILYVRQTWTDAKGEHRHHLSFDQFRVAGGMIAEHWDADD